MGTSKDSTLFEIGNIPSELTLPPTTLIYFQGLDPSNNEIHRSIWKKFSSYQSRIRFELIDETTKILPAKPKKSSYNCYVPSGILKTNWLNKHLYKIPSVVVLFFHLDWSDSDYNNKVLICSSKLDFIRRKLNGRNCKIALVLIQQNPIISTENILASENALHLCQSFDISISKSLFVLPIGNDEDGYIRNMEDAFFELASLYYQSEVKQIRTHKDLLNKTNHSYLYVRHQFKIAFFSELRQDIRNAIQSYKQAYLSLMEVRRSVINLFEIKTIASFITYKICRLFFQKDPKEAISSFFDLITIFKNSNEPIELEFEHFAWLSKQFALFADSFSHAIHSGLVSFQMQHPGYYYYQAALYSKERRKACSKIPQEVNDFDPLITKNIIEGHLTLEYYGQRPWRPCCKTLEPLDTKNEKQGIVALQYHEKKFVDHKALIIDLLTNAMWHYKSNKGARMMRYMKVLIGKEYFLVHDYKNCLNCLMQVLPQYRQERWKPLLVSVLFTTFSSAYFSANSIEFVKIGLELISNWVPLGYDLKSDIQKSIIRILSGDMPLNLSICPQEELSNVVDLWTNSCNIIGEIHLEMNSSSFIQVKPQFQSVSCAANEQVKLRLYFYLNSPNPMKFDSLRCHFNKSKYDKQCILINSNSSTLEFVSGRLFFLEFDIRPHVQDSGEKVRLKSIKLFIGLLELYWNYSDSIKDPKEIWYHGGFGDKNKTMFHSLKSRSFFQIEKLRPRVALSILDKNSLHTNEKYPLLLKLTNQHSNVLQNVSIKVLSNEEISESTILYLENEILKLNSTIQISPLIECNKSIEKIIYIFTNKITSHKFYLTVYFDINISKDISKTCEINEEFSFTSSEPFSINFQLCNALGLPAKNIRIMEPFILKVDITSLSTFLLDINQVNLELNNGFFLMKDEQLRNNSLKQMKLNDINESSFLIYSDTINVISLGSLIVKWKRKGFYDFNITKLSLPSVNVEDSIIYIETLLPKYGITRQHLQLTYNIYNRTNKLLPVKMMMGSSENFMYSGNKCVKLEIGGKEMCSQYYVLYPLVCGDVALPKLEITAYPDNDQSIHLNQVLEDILPSVFRVMPAEKSLV